MEKQHLTYFKIENFKRFDSFEMSNLGQFNLIVGDNNVGKTSVLEGLLFDEDLTTLMVNYLGSLQHRNAFGAENESMNYDRVNETQFWMMIFKSILKPIKITYTGTNTNQKELIVQVNKLSEFDSVTQDFMNKNMPRSPEWWIKLTTNNDKPPEMKGAYFEHTVGYFDQFIPFIPVNVGYGNELVNYFYQYFNSDKQLRRELESNLKFFIPTIEETRIHRFGQTQDVLSVTLTDSNEIYPIFRYGDATVKYVRILIEALIAKKGRLMVDEIGSGIHFTRLVDYWKTIIQLCDKYQVQLFATTHSLECQQAFIEALEDPEMIQYQKDARNISFIENKKGEVLAVTYDFEQFEYALNIGFNTRGGKR